MPPENRLRDFLDAAEKKRKPLVNGEDGIEALRPQATGVAQARRSGPKARSSGIVGAALESIRDRKVVELS